MALTGANVLSGELALNDDIGVEIAASESALRPMIEQAQGIPQLVSRLANPHSTIGIDILHAVLTLASRPTLR